MKQLLILSGKGGTGKTTTAAAFIAFANAQAFTDCDVDAPNLHLLQQFADEPRTTDYLGGQKAQIDPARCIGCGLCQQHCRFDAIRRKAEGFEVNPIACEGCGVCVAVCPEHAVTLLDDVAGEQMLYRDGRVFSTAKLKMGRGNSGKLVTEVKKALTVNSDAEFAIVDGSPGIGCPVIASISGAHMVLLVAEPTVSGISDLQRVIKTCQGFGTKCAVCVNKADVSSLQADHIEQFCRDNGIPFVGRIPYDETVPKAINEGKNIAETACPAREALLEIYQEVMNLFFEA